MGGSFGGEAWQPSEALPTEFWSRAFPGFQLCFEHMWQLVLLSLIFVSRYTANYAVITPLAFV